MANPFLKNSIYNITFFPIVNVPFFILFPLKEMLLAHFKTLPMLLQMQQLRGNNIIGPLQRYRFATPLEIIRFRSYGP